MGQLLTTLLAARLWRGHMRDATRVRGRWAGLAPEARASGDLAEAAGVEATVPRLTDQLEHAQAQLDLSYQSAFGR